MRVLKTCSKVGGRLVTSSHQSQSTKFRVSTVPRHLFASAVSDVTIWNLPEELLFYLLRGLHIRDLLNMRSVHPAFRDVIDSNSTVWQAASFADTWPSVHNIKHFERAAKHRNIESLLKLAIAYLYNEGLPHDEEGQRMRTNGMMAAAMFCDVETLTPNVTPFTWLFIRPPWSAGRACCKECVFKNMLLYVKQHQDTNVAMCVSQILKLFEDSESQARMIRYLTLAAQGGNKPAMYQLWCEKYQNKVCDKAMELHSARELRDIASLGELEAQLALCRYYSTTQYSSAQFVQHCGVSREAAVGTVRHFLQSSTPSNAHLIFTYHPDISNTMRYILIDWLVEVAGMKEFSTHTLHVAVSVVDRFLRAHRMTRSRLQLLGVAAMVLCSRFLGKDIITIREAAWLTDNTYKYEDVVRMMGEVVATLRGEIRVVTSLDYLYILEDLAQVDDTTKYMAEYACEISLLHAELSRYKRAEVAAGCLLFARLVLKKHYPWSNQLQEFTGFTSASLTKCIVHLYSKCFVSGKITDHRDVELEAVKQRYSGEDFCSVSQVKLPGLDEVCSLLGVSEYVFVENDLQVRFKHQTVPQSTTCCGTHPSAFGVPGTLPGCTTPATVVTGSFSPVTSINCGGTSLSGRSAALLSNCSTTVRMEDSGGYDADCSMSGNSENCDKSNSTTADLNANYDSVKSLNPTDGVATATIDNGVSIATPGVLMATPTASPASSSASVMQIYRCSSKEKMAPLSTENTPLLTSDISSENPLPGELRTPRKLKVKPRLHDHSGRHNIPSLPVPVDEVPMQESPIKHESAGSPMKTD